MKFEESQVKTERTRAEKVGTRKTGGESKSTGRERQAAAGVMKGTGRTLKRRASKKTEGDGTKEKERRRSLAAKCRRRRRRRGAGTATEPRASSSYRHVDARGLKWMTELN